MCKLVVRSGFYEELSVSTPSQKCSFFHHAVGQNWSETQISPILFSWEHQKYQNIHPGAYFGTSLGGSWGGRRVPPCSCSTKPLNGNSEVHLHTPTKFGEDRSKDLGGDREQTDKQTNAARFIVWFTLNWWRLTISTWVRSLWKPYGTLMLKALWGLQSICKQKYNHLLCSRCYIFMNLLIFGQSHP